MTTLTRPKAQALKGLRVGQTITVTYGDEGTPTHTVRGTYNGLAKLPSGEQALGLNATARFIGGRPVRSSMAYLIPVSFIQELTT